MATVTVKRPGWTITREIPEGYVQVFSGEIRPSDRVLYIPIGKPESADWGRPTIRLVDVEFFYAVIRKEEPR